ncbi:MAG TPA: nucleoside-diphosphate kinase [Firmicutes bacterium]|jgi:nucleoside-diphosphate kinase|nr:nucleoside-diphosphate kinase [Bacillota bacterium]HAA34331.1 nucleoside-diphosphate kinase [Bacillota bacterium]
MEKTFVMLKPDAIQRSLAGEIISRLEKRGLKLVALKMLLIDRGLAEQHYGEHKGKPFFDDLVNFITSGPVIAMIWEGKQAVQVVRKMMGSTDPQEAMPGTIRGDYGLFTGNNIIHGSDSPESARREISLFFSEDEIIVYHKESDKWLYG